MRRGNTIHQRDLGWFSDYTLQWWWYYLCFGQHNWLFRLSKGNACLKLLILQYKKNNKFFYFSILIKIDILGQQIWEYSHQCDHVELKEALNIKRNGLTDKIKDENMIEEGISTEHRDLFVRLKCTLTSRGRSINIKSASYKVC